MRGHSTWLPLNWRLGEPHQEQEVMPCLIGRKDCWKPGYFVPSLDVELWRQQRVRVKMYIMSKKVRAPQKNTRMIWQWGAVYLSGYNGRPMYRGCVLQRPSGPFAMCHSLLSSCFQSSLSCPINKAIKGQKNNLKNKTHFVSKWHVYDRVKTGKWARQLVAEKVLLFWLTRTWQSFFGPSERTKDNKENN